VKPEEAFAPDYVDSDLEKGSTIWKLTANMKNEK
jgi:hypothetical protein